MSKIRIALMEGDGIGPEVVRATADVMAEAARLVGTDLEYVPLPIGLEAYEQFGTTMPGKTFEALQGCDGWLLGPLTTHVYGDDGAQEMPNPSGFLRKRCNLYANVRPVRSFSGVSSFSNDVNLIVVRENTEGFYADRNMLDGPSEFRPNEDTVLSMRVVTRKASLRVARQAFELARARAKHSDRPGVVTAVHKANVLKMGDGLFLECCREIAKDYPEIELNDFHADAFAMYLITRPADFDVVVTTNMFGDILSDEAAGLIGGLGLAPGLNVGDEMAMAQATHGSAPDIAGQGFANPVAEILSGSMLLRWLGQRTAQDSLLRAAELIEGATELVLSDSRNHTRDLGGNATTSDLASAINDTLIGISTYGDSTGKAPNDA